MMPRFDDTDLVDGPFFEDRADADHRFAKMASGNGRSELSVLVQSDVPEILISEIGPLVSMAHSIQQFLPAWIFF